MCDTNWCTYCDRAVNPLSNSIYCSEACFRQDAKQDFFIPQFDDKCSSGRRDSISSEDLAALHFDDILELSKSPELSSSRSTSSSTSSSSKLYTRSF